MAADQVPEFRDYFVGIGVLSKGKMRIMNKYIAGLFKNIRTTEFRIRIGLLRQVSEAGMYEIVILYSKGMF